MMMRMMLVKCPGSGLPWSCPSSFALLPGLPAKLSTVCLFCPPFFLCMHAGSKCRIFDRFMLITMMMRMMLMIVMMLMMEMLMMMMMMKGSF